MFCINIRWFICTFVAVAIATNSNGEEGQNYISESPTAEPVHKTQPTTGVDLGAAEGATATLAALSPESAAQTSSASPADSEPSPYAATQPHSSRQPPATAAPTVAAQTIPQTEDDRISLLRSLSPEEKGSRLIEAAQQGAMRELETLLAAGADVEARGGWLNGTALHHAAEKEQEEAARRLLAAGAAVNARDSWQMTPLHYAARQGQEAVVRLLLSAGADHSARNANGWTPLHMATFNHNAEAADALVEAGADTAARNNEGKTPLDFTRQLSQLLDLLDGDSSLTATNLPE